MKIEVLRDELARILGYSSRFASQRAQLPVLENVALIAKKTRLVVMATNLEISIAASIGAKVSEEGEIAVPARMMSDLVGGIGHENVVLSSKREVLRVEGEGFSAMVNGMNMSDFPKVEQSLGKGKVVLKEKAVKDFVGALDKVLFSVSRDDTRPVLTGVLFILRGENLTLVSSDGFRLSQKKVFLGKAGSKGRVIIPRMVLGEIAKVLGGGEDIGFLIKESENQVLIGVEGVVLGSRIIEGAFPDFEKIMPKTTRTKVRVGKDDLWQAMKTASVFARESGNVVRLVVREGEIEVVAESAKSGKQETRVPAKVEGEGQEISYNWRFVEEFLGVVEGEEVVIELNDATSPGVFRDPGDKDYLHLIMPVRVQG